MGEQLILLVRDNPVLYDKSRLDYMDAEMKDNIWARIAAELGRDGKFPSIDINVRSAKSPVRLW